jgi:hypothetical protein
MGDPATIKGQSGDAENYGLSILDLVKHAIKTVIQSLDDADSLSIVSYSDNARTDFALSYMTKDGKKRATDALEALHTEGSTNLWAGLREGLESIRKATGRQGRNQTVFVFTDGQPNVLPPEGHIPALQNYKDQYKDFRCTINTFGFGYNLDSPLLDEIALEGDGMYCFIPDGSFVGTIFVHALSNLLSTIATSAVLSIEPINNAKILENGILGAYQTHSSSWGATLHIGSITYSQTKDIVIRMDVPEGEQPYVNVVLSYEDPHQKVRKEFTVEGSKRNGSENVEKNKFRLMTINCIKNGMKFIKDQNDMTKALNGVQTVIDEINASQTKDTDYVISLMKDLQGQITEAFSRRDWYDKWGRHYLPSLSRSHLLQMCNNFKDPGVQGYGGPLFQKIRDEVDDIFCKLPPPTPTSYTASSSNYTPVSSMSVYNYSYNPCFDGECLVKMNDETMKKVKDIKKDDIIMTSNGDSTKVQCVVKTNCRDNKAKLVNLNGLLITPWHPVRVENEWHFPSDLGTSIVRYCPAVYSFVLESEHIMIINGTECVTLGHSFKGPVVGHDYFGSERIVNDLRKIDGWKNGIVELTSDCLIRNKETGLVCGILKN